MVNIHHLASVQKMRNVKKTHFSNITFFERYLGKNQNGRWVQNG